MNRRTIRRELSEEYGRLGRLVRQIKKPTPREELPQEFVEEFTERLAKINELERLLNGAGE